MDTLLNWDGDESRDDMLKNIGAVVHHHTGWPLLAVWLEGSVLHIEAMDDHGHQEQLLVYDPTGCGREVYGRLRNVGIDVEMRRELKLLVLH